MNRKRCLIPPLTPVAIDQARLPDTPNAQAWARLPWVAIGLISFSALLAVSCGEAAQPIETSQEDSEISSRTPAFVTLRRDFRRCIAPLCGGYYAKDVNRDRPEVYVSGLDFSESNLDETTIAKVNEAPDLIIYGRLGPKETRFNTRPLIVLQAYRGLAGNVARNDDVFYSVAVNDPPIQCFAAPCNNNRAERLNSRREPVSFTAVDPLNVQKSHVDPNWLIGRVERHGALVAGHFANGQQFPAGRESLLVASQIYIRLPDSSGPCPLPPIQRCEEPTVNVFSRNADRCVLPAGCVESGMCVQSMPVCDEGYVLQSWASAPNACPAYACDPDFIVDVPPVGRCARVRCAQGYHCVEEGPDACVPDLTCASILCAPDTRCVEENGLASCVANVWVTEDVELDSGNPYRNHERRVWLLSSETAGATALRINFSRFDLERGWDFFVVQDLAGNELARYSGPLGAFTSDTFDGNAVRIMFITDGSITQSGFAITSIDARTN